MWFHGASAGDLSTLAPMMRALKEARPEVFLIVTCVTNSGAAMARQLPEVDLFLYLPFDLPGATRRAARVLRPSLVVLEYTEIWPLLIRALGGVGAKLVLTNGRFDQEKLWRYRWLFAFTGRPLERLDLLLMREDSEAERALALGAHPDKVWVTGSTKFDALVSGRPVDDDALRAGLGLREGAPVWLAGSTHEGEEALLLELHAALRRRHPDLQLVLAPRYLERVERVRGLVEAAGFQARLRSEPPAGRSAGRPEVVILDTIGELSAAYAFADVVFVGGSFTQRGGQNMLEPAARGRPVLFGPNTHNFTDVVQFLAGRGGIQVSDPAHLQRVLGDLLERPPQREALGALARETVMGLTGASARNIQHILTLWEGPR